MPHPRATSIIRALVSEHYGVRGMPLSVMLREDEIGMYETEHSEVMPALWEFVDHNRRIVRMWARLDPCVDLVVWCPNTESYKLVQDLCFKDAYPDAATWTRAVLELIRVSPEVWVVTHLS